MFTEFIPAILMIVVFIAFAVMRHYESKCSEIEEKSFDFKDLDNPKCKCANKYYVSTIVFLGICLGLMVLAMMLIVVELMAEIG